MKKTRQPQQPYNNYHHRVVGDSHDDGDDDDHDDGGGSGSAGTTTDDDEMFGQYMHGEDNVSYELAHNSPVRRGSTTRRGAGGAADERQYYYQNQEAHANFFSSQMLRSSSNDDDIIDGNTNRTQAMIRYLERYEQMVHTQEEDLRRTTDHLKPLFGIMCQLATAEAEAENGTSDNYNSNHNSSGRHNTHHHKERFKIMIDNDDDDEDDDDYDDEQEDLSSTTRLLSYKGMKLVLDMMEQRANKEDEEEERGGADEGRQNNIQLDLLQTDDQLVWLLREIVTTTISQSSLSSNEQRPDEGEEQEGLTFWEFVQCYRMIVGGNQTMEHLRTGNGHFLNGGDALPPQSQLVLHQEGRHDLSEITKQRTIEMIHTFGKSHTTDTTNTNGIATTTATATASTSRAGPPLVEEEEQSQKTTEEQFKRRSIIDEQRSKFSKYQRRRIWRMAIGGIVAFMVFLVILFLYNDHVPWLLSSQKETRNLNSNNMGTTQQTSNDNDQATLLSVVLKQLEEQNSKASKKQLKALQEYSSNVTRSIQQLERSTLNYQTQLADLKQQYDNVITKHDQLQTQFQQTKEELLQTKNELESQRKRSTHHVEQCQTDVANMVSKLNHEKQQHEKELQSKTDIIVKLKKQQKAQEQEAMMALMTTTSTPRNDSGSLISAEDDDARQGRQRRSKKTMEVIGRNVLPVAIGTAISLLLQAAVNFIL